MASRLALVFLLGVLFATPLFAIKSFDFFYLVLMWPGAYCAQSKCCLPTTGLPAEDFFLRGLWTYNGTDSTNMKPVTKCIKNSPFYINQLSNMSEELNSYWSNIRCPSTSPKSSWKSTWKTWGVCSGMNETDYFQFALELRAEADLLSFLSKKGIYPDYNLYNLTDIQSAIAEGIGVTPDIRCSKGPFGKFQLYEVYICVNKVGKFVECPGFQGFTCSSSILFHPFHDWMFNKTSTSAIDSNHIKMPISWSDLHD
ncbi:extracellular ribonuclease LE [Cocos nucifera]|uniref:Extracellular ribonuclease LE n=1 Tax=Cocos nucifera TaxID=13894 RepID=A0A8K0MVW5_COCNU|nr:extracellular ribonuclease LE [Cocos nucifera]